jgi:hypothetical protein
MFLHIPGDSSESEKIRHVTLNAFVLSERHGHVTGATRSIRLRPVK